MARILIAGAGALGSVFGALLRGAGHAVTLLGRAAHLEAIDRNGLQVSGIWGEHTARDFELATQVGELRGEFEAILVTVKAYDTETVAATTAARLASTGVMISLQNGLGNVEALADVVGGHRVLGGRVIFGAAVSAPGAVTVTVYADPVLIGAWHSSPDSAADALAHHWAQTFQAAGVPCAYCDDIAAALWAKVFYNAALNPLGALLGVPYGLLPAHPESKLLMDRVIDEAFAVACAEGMQLPWGSAEQYRTAFYGRLVPATFDHRSSMLQDLERGRRTEIEAINGQVWQLGAKHGIATPVNELLTRLLRARQRMGV